MDPLASLLPDELLARAAASISIEPGGGWGELFVERLETVRGEWDSRAGLRVSPGIREGFALRVGGITRQKHRTVEGLDADRILKACRGGEIRRSRGVRSPPSSGEDSAAMEEPGRRIASILESWAGDLSRRLPGPPPFSLSLEWRRRRIRIAVPREPVHSDLTARAVLTLRLRSGSEEIVLGLGAEDLDLLVLKSPMDRLYQEAQARWVEEERRDAPEGETTVVLAPGTGGVFLHEACGHALEGDLVLREASVFSRLLGERVAPDFVGAMDDPTRPGLEGSYACDDEGSPSRGTVLIAAGVLKAFLTDRITGERLGRGTTGNGRRESFRDLPLPRMSNSFLTAGSDDPEDILKCTSRGIYVDRLEGGRVDTATGDFLFHAGAGRLVEEGRLTAPLRPFLLAGNGLAALRDLDRIGSDLFFGTGAGSCGKEGQQVPVAVGQPTIRLRSLRVRPA